MQSLVELNAVAAPLAGDNIDTDRIIPARLLRNPRDETHRYDRWLFHDLRFDDEGHEIGDFVLNQRPFRAAEIVVSGANFGCGSSRESAVYALLDYGVRVVIAESFGDIFQANCVRNGVAPLTATKDALASLRRWLLNAAEPRLTVDLKTLRVTSADGSQRLPVSIPEFQRHCLMHGIDEIELTLERSERIEAFEQRYLERFPWLSVGVDQ